MKLSLLLLVLLSEAAVSSSEELHYDVGIMNRIVGGINVDSNEYPFMVSWHMKDGGGIHDYPGCGGSLVAPNLVLTAAHCDYMDGSVRVGSIYARGDSTKGGDDSTSGIHNDGIVANVINRYPHPDYVHNATTLAYDFMILELDRTIDPDLYPPILLNFDTNLPSNGDLLTVIGFGTGTTNNNNNNVNGEQQQQQLQDSGGSDILQQVQLPTVDFDMCQDQYDEDDVYLFSDSHFCAGGGSIGDFDEGDSCQGDSGGPIFQWDMANEGYTLMGVVSFGSPHCDSANNHHEHEDRFPGIYAKISTNVNWLRTQICSHATQKDLLPYCRTKDKNNKNNNNNIAPITTNKMATATATQNKMLTPDLIASFIPTDKMLTQDQAAAIAQNKMLAQGEIAAMTTNEMATATETTTTPQKKMFTPGMIAAIPANKMLTPDMIAAIPTNKMLTPDMIAARSTNKMAAATTSQNKMLSRDQAAVIATHKVSVSNELANKLVTEENTPYFDDDDDIIPVDYDTLPNSKGLWYLFAQETFEMGSSHLFKKGSRNKRTKRYSHFGQYSGKLQANDKPFYMKSSLEVRDYSQVEIQFYYRTNQNKSNSGKTTNTSEKMPNTIQLYLEMEYDHGFDLGEDNPIRWIVAERWSIDNNNDNKNGWNFANIIVSTMKSTTMKYRFRSTTPSDPAAMDAIFLDDIRFLGLKKENQNEEDEG